MAPLIFTSTKAVSSVDEQGMGEEEAEEEDGAIN